MAPKIKIPVRRTGRALAHLHSKPSPHTRLVPHFAGTLRSPQNEMRSAHGWRQPELHFGEARTRFPASHEPPAALRGNPALTSDQNALRAWGHKNFGAFAPCKRFAQQNLGGGRIHFARAFQFPERNPKKEVTTYVVTSFFVMCWQKRYWIFRCPQGKECLQRKP